MSVTLNEVALAALLQAEEGPVMRDIKRRAERAAEALQVRMAQIIENQVVVPQAGVEMTPDGAIVGIRDHGSVAQYMDFKLGEKEPWWEPFGKGPAASAV